MSGDELPGALRDLRAAWHRYVDLTAPLRPALHACCRRLTGNVAPRMQRAVVAGEPVALGFVTRRGRKALEQVMRIGEELGAIARLRGYAFCPETMRGIGYPTPAPGRSFE